MKSTSLRRAVFVAVGLVLALTACSPGFNAQTDQVYQPAEGVVNRDKEVDVLNALIVSGEDGSGTFVANLVNNNVEQADRLVSVSGPEVTVPAAALGGDAATAIPANGALNLAAEGNVAVRGEGVVAGRFVELTLTFASGEAVTIRVPVVRNDGDYTDVPLPSERPTGNPTDGTTVEPSAEPEAELTEESGPSQEPTGNAG